MVLVFNSPIEFGLSLKLSFDGIQSFHAVAFDIILQLLEEGVEVPQ